MQHPFGPKRARPALLPMPSLLSSLPSVTSLAGTALLLAAAIGGCASLADANRAATHGAPIDGAGVTVFAAGDIADCSKVAAAASGAARTAAIIEAGIAGDPATRVLAMGDTSYPVGKPAEFSDCYAPTWGRFKDRTLPAPGNHEYYSPGAAGYYGYFGALAGPEERGYFSADVGAWHVLSLNSNLKGDASAHQLAWVEADLAHLRRQAPTRCVLAFWHHPVYSSGGHGNNPQMVPVWQALLAARADVVLSAHDHDYERFAPQNADAGLDQRGGIREFIVGTGGAHLTPFTGTKAHSQAQDNSTNGVLKLVLKPTGYEWGFMPADGSAVRDAGSAPCHGA